MNQRSEVIKESVANCSKENSVRFINKPTITSILCEYNQGIKNNYKILLSQIADQNAKFSGTHLGQLLCGKLVVYFGPGQLYLKTRFKNEQSSQIIEWFQDFKCNAHMLDKHHTVVVKALLKVKWMEREYEVVSQFRNFVIALVTANPIHLRTVMLSLARSFYENVDSTTTLQFDPGLARENAIRATHSIFNKIFSIIPQSLNVVEKVFSDCCPHMSKPDVILEAYVKELLAVTSYRIQLRPFIFELIFKSVVQLDVHSPKDEIEEADEDEASDEEIFEMDEDEKLDQTAGNDQSPMRHPLANKLDILLQILFEYVHDTCYVNDKFQPDAARKLFREVVFAFDKIVFPIYQINHVQFILFYICSFKQRIIKLTNISKSIFSYYFSTTKLIKIKCVVNIMLESSYCTQTFYDSFIDFCWKKVTDVSLAVVLRQTSACYIASLLARAKYIPLSTAEACLTMMCQWSQRYLAKALTNGLSLHGQCDTMRHGVFYSVCQAIFYIVVFRHQQILDSKNGHSFVQSLNLQHLILSPLNPLKMCLSSVVTLFASAMRLHQLVFCDSIIERNNRQGLPVVGSVTSEESESNPLESFFPFDPYLLKRSVTHVKPLYIEWTGEVPAQSKELEDSRDDDFLDAVEEGTQSMSIKESSFVSSASPGFGYLTQLQS